MDFCRLRLAGACRWIRLDFVGVLTLTSLVSDSVMKVATFGLGHLAVLTVTGYTVLGVTTQLCLSVSHQSYLLLIWLSECKL